MQLADQTACVDVKDLRAAVAARGDVLRVLAEAHAAHHTRMREGVHDLHARRSVDEGIIDDVPILGDAFEVRGQLLGVEVRELVADAFEFGVAVLEVGGDLGVAIYGWRRAGNAWRERISICLTLLRRGRRSEAAVANERFTWRRRGGLLGWRVAWEIVS